MQFDIELPYYVFQELCPLNMRKSMFFLFCFWALSSDLHYVLKY